MRGIAIVASPLILAGCLVSKEAVFDAKEAVAPLPIGRYKVEQYKDSSWIFVEEWEVKPANEGYVLVNQKSEQRPVWLFELSQDAYVMDVSMHDEHQYGIARVSQGSIVVSGVNCSVYLGSETAKKFVPVRDAGGYVSLCYFDDNQQLFGAIRESAQLAEPILRLTPIFQSANIASASSPPTRQPLTSLKLCNKSPVVISVMIHHQHQFDASKEVLSGWYDIKAGQCRDIGKFRQPGLSVFGASFHEGGRSEWTGKSKPYCVTQRQTYRVVLENERCVPGEAAKSFAEIKTTSDAFTYTFGWNQ